MNFEKVDNLYAAEQVGESPAARPRSDMAATMQASLTDLPVHCSRCGYDIRVTPADMPCPECGQYAFATHAGIRVEGKHVVVRSGASLPPRCIKTNQPVDAKPRKAKLYYLNPLWLLLLVPLLFLWVIPALIVALILQKRGEMQYYVHPEVHWKYTLRQWLGVLVLLLSLGGYVAAVYYESWLIAGVSFVVMIFSFVIIAMYKYKPAARKHNNDQFWIKGCCTEFVEELRHATMSPDAVDSTR